MRRGSTPTVTLEIEDVDLSQLKNLSVTFSQNGKILKKYKGDDAMVIEPHRLLITLTQEETLSFKSSYPVEIQVKMLTQEGKVIPTTIEQVPITAILDDEVMK